jgi:DNA-binding transcriptional LysR family regulator
MMNTELRQVRHVVTLGKHLSFTRAAKALSITQSALTRSIQAIEEKAGTRLFDRDRGRVSLTEVGKAYLARAEALLQDAQDLDRLLGQTAVGDVGEVQFGITSAVARSLLPDVLLQELVYRPLLRSVALIRTPETMLEMVHNESLEFCICGEQPDPPAGLRTTTIGTLRLALLVRQGHPLPADRETLDLTGYPLLLSGQASDAARLSVLAHPFKLAPASIVIDDLGVLSHIVVNSDAIWISAPAATLTGLRSGLLRELPLPPRLNLNFRVMMYSHARRTLSPAARRLAELIRAQAARRGSGSLS